MKKFIILIFVTLFAFTANSQSLSKSDKYFLNKLSSKNAYTRQALKLGMVVNRVHKNKMSSQNFSQRAISKYTNFGSGQKSPKELFREYRNKSSELNSECEEVKEEISVRVDKNVNQIKNSITNILKKADVNLSPLAKLAMGVAGEVAKKQRIKKLNQQIEEEKRKAQKEIDNKLRRRLEPIRDKAIRENNDYAAKYRKASFYSASKTDESYYSKMYDFHNCVSSYIKRKFTIDNMDWLRPQCNEPYKQSYLSVEENSFDLAKHKYRKYETTNEDGWLNASDVYLDKALNENPEDYRIYEFKSDIQSDILTKYENILIANKLAPENTMIENKVSESRAELARKFFSAIKNKQNYFVNQTVDKQYHLGLTEPNTNNSPLAAAISYDNSGLMNQLLRDNDDATEDLTQNGHFYLFSAIISNSYNCVKSLIKMGVNINYKDPEQNNITALNIAVDKKNEAIAKTIMNDSKINLNIAFNYAKYTAGKEHLDLLSLYAYKNNANSITTIFKYNPNFVFEIDKLFYPQIFSLTEKNLDLLFKTTKIHAPSNMYNLSKTVFSTKTGKLLIDKYYPNYADNFGNVAINTSNPKARIYINDEFVGSGDIKLNDLEKADMIKVRIKSKGQHEEMFRIPVIGRKTTHVDVTLVKEISLKKMLTDKDFDADDFYVTPLGIKKVPKKHFLGGILGTVGVFGFLKLTNGSASTGSSFLLGGLVGFPIGYFSSKAIGKKRTINNEIIENQAKYLAKEKMSDKKFKDNQLISTYNIESKQENYQNLRNRSIKYKIDNGEYKYIVKPN